MKTSIKIYIPSLIRFQIYLMLVMDFFISVLSFPKFISYLLDVNMVALLLCLAVKKRKARFERSTMKVYHYLLLYMVSLVIYALLRLVPPGQILWAVRNNFFYLLFGVICAAFLQKKDLENILSTVVKFQVINVACGLFEFFVLDSKNDYLGGMFGISQGCNGLLNTYLVIICAHVVSGYVYRRESTAKVIWIIGSSMLMAALSELKIFYFELILIALFVFLSKRSMKNIVIVLGVAAGLLIGLQILYAVSPQSLTIFTNRKNLLDYLTITDYGDHDIRISRVTVIPQINELFFKKNYLLRLFGYGLGACEDSESFSFFNSEFAVRYGFLGYRNLSASMLYLETGLIGLILFVLVFVIVFIHANMVKNKRILSEDEAMIIFVQTVCLLTIVNIWYNSSIRRPIAYLTFFSLSQIFVLLKQNGLPHTADPTRDPQAFRTR